MDRGVSNPLKLRRIKDTLSELCPDWFGIQESKLNAIDSSCIAQLTGWQNVGFSWSLAIDRVGGIIYCRNLASFRESSRFC